MTETDVVFTDLQNKLYGDMSAALTRFQQLASIHGIDLRAINSAQLTVSSNLLMQMVLQLEVSKKNMLKALAADYEASLKVAKQLRKAKGTA